MSEQLHKPTVPAISGMLASSGRVKPRKREFKKPDEPPMSPKHRSLQVTSPRPVNTLVVTSPRSSPTTAAGSPSPAASSPGLGGSPTSPLTPGGSVAGGSLAGGSIAGGSSARLIPPPTPGAIPPVSGGTPGCHPEYRERLDEVCSANEKFRDRVVSTLFAELRSIPTEGLIPCPGVAARGLTAMTAIAILDAIATELDSPLKDSSSALKDSGEGLRRAVEVVRLTQKRRDEAELAAPLIAVLARVVTKKARVMGPQNRERSAQEAVDSGTVNVIAEAMSPNAKSKTEMTSEFPIDAFALLSDCLACQTTRSAVRQLCLNESVPEAADLALKHTEATMETKNAASEFALHFADDPADRARPDKNKGVPLPTLMRVTRRKVRTAQPLDETMLTATPRTLANFDGGVDLTEELKQIVRQVDNPTNHKDSECAVAFAELVSSFATKRRIKAIRDTGAHEVMLRMLRANADNPEVVGPLLDGFSALCEDNERMQVFTAVSVPPAVKAEAISGDPDCAYKYVDLLEDLVVFAENEAAEAMAKQKVGRDLDALETAADPEDTPLLCSITDVRKALNSKDDPLSLKEVYGVLMARSHGDETLNIQDDRSVKRMFNFARKKTKDYGTAQVLEDQTTLASEFMYGCLSFQLLASVEDNHSVLKRFDIPQILLDSMATQTDEQICQHAVLTALELAQYDQIVPLFVDRQDKINFIVSLLKRGRAATENDLYTDVEDLIGARVQLIEKTAVTRGTYKGSEAVKQLLETWDDYDYYFYGNVRIRTPDDLKQLFKVERKDKRRQKFGRRMSQRDQSLDRRGSFVRRASLFFKKDEAAASPTPSVPAGHSPLERRRSVVNLTRRQSVGTSAKRGESASPSLIKRASHFFGLGHKSPNGAVGLGGTISAARKSSQNAPTRRGSFFSRGSPTTVTPTPSPNGLKRRASLLQRRASMQAPTSQAELHTIHSKLARKANNDTATPSPASGTSESKWSEPEIEPEVDVFIPRMIEYVFRALRRTVGADEILLLRSCNVPMRLVGLIADPETPPAALPDVLYLIGVLAGSHKDLKDELGDYHAVEKVCSLLKRAFREQGSFVSEVVTNACLCLATLCVVHVPNTKRFERKKGAQLTVATLNVRGEYNDTQAVNGVSALICNLCFKNEEMKALLGQAGACEALVHAMAHYESNSLSVGATRCISSLFKAIGNLALNQSNMERLMASDIEVAYASFLTQVDGGLDDATLEAALRTLSNLVIEKDNMERFAPIVVPFLSMLRRERTTSTEVHRWAFMTLAGLCRLPKNAQMFSHNDGIKTIINILPYIEQTPSLRASIICVLGIQTTWPDNVDLLIENGVFVIIADNLREFMDLIARESETVETLSSLKTAEAPPPTNEEQAANILTFSQLPISSLRCAHRCLAHQSAAEECIQEKVFALAQDVLLNSAFQPMLTYEALRVMFGCLGLYGSQHFATRDDFPFLMSRTSRQSGDVSQLVSETGWGAKELDMLIDGDDPQPELPPYTDPTEPQWLVRLGDHVRRPVVEDEPRLWEELHMTGKLRQLTECVRTIASSDKAARNVRLQRCALGFLAWVSCERICIPSLLRRLHVPLDPVTKAPVEEEDEQAEEADRIAGTHTVNKQPLQRRTSVWDTFKRDKPTEQVEKKDGFGRERKHDHTSIIDIVSRTMENLWFDEDCIDLAFILLNNCLYVAFGNPELCLLLADVKVYKEIKQFVDRHEDRARAYWILTSQNYKRFLQTEGKWSPVEDSGEMLSEGSETMKSGQEIDKKRILQPEDLNLMRELSLTSFPIDLTQWSFDPFPDGVQSLPAETRRKLREGGRAEVVNGAGKRSLFLYKASHDLVLFEWKIIPLEAAKQQNLKDVDPQFPHALAVSRFSLMMAGIQHPWFERAAQNDRGITENRCALLRGPAIATNPEGVTLCLKFRDCRTRDAFLLTLSNWREACAFGFI